MLFVERGTVDNATSTAARPLFLGDCPGKQTDSPSSLFRVEAYPRMAIRSSLHVFSIRLTDQIGNRSVCMS